MTKFLVLLLLAAGAVLAQRPEPAFDPDTKDGMLIQHIQQEQDPAAKLHYMEQFAAEYPSHKAIAWVYDQLQPAYFAAKEYDQAIRIGSLRLAIEPDNMEAAEIALRSADAKHDLDQTFQWADRAWQVSSAIAAKGGPNAAAAPQVETYAEFCIYSSAMGTADLKTRLSRLQTLEQRSPSTKYVQNFPAEYFKIYQQMGDEGKIVEMAEKGIRANPENVDMLMALAEVHFRANTPEERNRVIGYTAKAIEALGRRVRPPSISAADWEKAKSRVLARAYYLSGMSNVLNDHYSKADTMLRSALAYSRGEAEQAALLYYLGMANYRLAEAGRDRRRPVDALKYMRRCADMKSPYQEQAVKNVAAIRSEYSLP